MLINYCFHCKIHTDTTFNIFGVSSNIAYSHFFSSSLFVIDRLFPLFLQVSLTVNVREANKGEDSCCQVQSVGSAVAATWSGRLCLWSHLWPSACRGRGGGGGWRRSALNEDLGRRVWTTTDMKVAQLPNTKICTSRCRWAWPQHCMDTPRSYSEFSPATLPH